MIDIAIVDDEKIIGEEIAGLIRSERSDCSVSLFEAGEELFFAGKSWDIIFLDICLEKENGLSIAKKIRETNENTVLIFDRDEGLCFSGLRCGRISLSAKTP